MKVYGVEIAENHIRAAIAAMIGTFQCGDVERALTVSGCPGMVSRVADRLLQKERKAGRIEAVTNKLWRAKP